MSSFNNSNSKKSYGKRPYEQGNHYVITDVKKTKKYVEENNSSNGGRIPEKIMGTFMKASELERLNQKGEIKQLTSDEVVAGEEPGDLVVLGKYILRPMKREDKENNLKIDYFKIKPGTNAKNFTFFNTFKVSSQNYFYNLNYNTLSLELDKHAVQHTDHWDMENVAKDYCKKEGNIVFNSKFKESRKHEGAFYLSFGIKNTTNVFEKDGNKPLKELNVNEILKRKYAGVEVKYWLNDIWVYGDEDTLKCCVTIYAQEIFFIV